MTDEQKLQQLFDAALKTPVANEGLAPKRAFPTPVSRFRSPNPPRPRCPRFTPAPGTGRRRHSPAAARLRQGRGNPGRRAPRSPPSTRRPPRNSAALLDERIVRKRRRRKLELVVTLILFFGSTVGGTAWFVQSPARITRPQGSHPRHPLLRRHQLHGRQIPGVHQQDRRPQPADRPSLHQPRRRYSPKPDRGDETMDAEIKQMMGGHGRQNPRRPPQGHARRLRQTASNKPAAPSRPSAALKDE
jgi:hypothetical protein